MTELEPARSAIVLAGGRSTRFGRDKLAEPLAGQSLLEHAVRAVASVVQDVVVIGSGGGPLAEVEGIRVRRVMDAEPFAGPLVALATALELVREPISLVVGGDMPTLVPGVLRVLARALESADGVDATCLLYRGRRQPLPMAVRVGAATPAVRRSVGSGERSLLSLLAVLRARDVGEADWRPLDPTAATLRDIDRPEDLRG